MKSFRTFALTLGAFALLPVGAAAAAQDLDPIPYTGPTPPAIDTTLGNELPVTGYYEEPVMVEGVERTSKVYIPDGMPVRGYFTVVSVPDGWDTEEFLTRSGWIDIADDRAEGLFVLEPDQTTGQWGDLATESSYITEAFSVMEAKRFYSTHGISYIAGYGTGGTALQSYVAKNPLNVISAVFIDTDDLSGLDQIGAQEFSFTPKFTDTGMDPRFTSVPYRDVPVPVWFVNDDDSDVSNLVSYWKQANDVRPYAVRGTFGDTYHQRARSERLPTSYSEPVSKVAVLERDVAYDDKRFTKRISRFLTYYTRYDNTTVFGNVLGTRPDYGRLGVDVKNLMVTEADGQVWKRQYLVYEPKKAKKHRGGAPVVYVFAGGSQPCTLFFDITRWWEIADTYGFTVVVPCSQYSGPPYTPLELRWNYTNANLDVKADDFEFIRQLTSVVDRDYDTDPGRRFAFGHSNGSMFEHGIAYRMPEYFTAIAGNGATSNPVPDSATSVVPLFLNMAENENGNPYLSNPGNLRDLVSYWLERNDVGLVDEPDSTQTGVGMLERTTLQRWNNDQGIPLYMYGITAARNHNVSVDTAWTAWEGWFSRWDKDRAGRLSYDGTRVLAQTSPLVQMHMPSALNLRTTAGRVDVILTADIGDLAAWRVSDVRLQGAAAVSVRCSGHGRTLVATFKKSDLSTLPAGKAVTVSATGRLERGGQTNPFTATTTLRVVR
ncbi:alpha/beta hydrolase family esterase [Mumia sp. Pv 4-285]|uniref:alpha/beta hydrolase family esterase n=1 Tax=Mumia qirimensis TaxID=3234852 RepID=UPI00351D264E